VLFGGEGIGLGMPVDWIQLKFECLAFEIRRGKHFFDIVSHVEGYFFALLPAANP
jgi:hypothetical protein